MNIIDNGIGYGSESFFHTPSHAALSLFYYVVCTGKFFCNKHYHLIRDSFDSILLMYIRRGSGTVTYNNNTVSISAGDVVLLNCYHPHEYQGDMDTLWLHFDGNASLHYFNYLYSRNGLVFRPAKDNIIERNLEAILHMFKTQQIIDEARCSCYINEMLCELYTLSCQLHDNSKKTNATITESINYMLEHYGEKLTLKQIAEKMCVSHYHFSHIFKKSTGYSPYEYLTLVRLNKAKQMLKTSHDSIHDIALSTGFNSEANFINCFKNHNKCTPAKFRNMPF